MNRWIKSEVLLLKSTDTQVSNKGDIYLVTHDPNTLYPLRICNEIPNSPTSFRKECIKMHLYILSDEEIVKDDIAFNTVVNSIGKVIDIDFEDNITIQDDSYNHKSSRNNYKKVIATTDKSLMRDEFTGVIDESNGVKEIIKHQFPQPSKSFIEKYVLEFCKGFPIAEVMVEYEEYEENKALKAALKIELNSNYGLRTKSVEDVQKTYEKYHNAFKLKTDSDNNITIRKVKSSWNKDEVQEIAQKFAQMIQKETAEKKRIVGDLCGFNEFIKNYY